jgi:glycosyltransferase involved in cell wall biosynthesis
MKVYLCGITQNQLKNIDDLTKNCYQAFDGLIYVDGGSTDGTKELLEERKGCGQVIYRKWTNDHDFQMNEFLRQGPMEIGDWFVLRDSRERFNTEWIADIKNLISKAKNSGIRSIYNYGKGFAFEYYDDMFFHGSPHWGLVGARNQAVDLSQFFDENKKEHTWRLRDGEDDPERDESYYIDHFFKYYYVYGRSNHLLLGRENDREGFQKAEARRVEFRMYCHSIGLEFTAESFLNYSKNSGANDFKFKSFINSEVILKDFYRKKVLNEPLKSIQENKFLIVT